MTNEEAIKILEECLGQGRFFDSSLKQAYDMAINALEKIDLIKFNLYALNELLKEADNE